MKKFRAGLISLLCLLMWAYTAEARYKRIVILYAPASPIVEALGAADRVVGVTRTDHLFKHAKRVGSHLRPNIELIKALRPDLIIAGSKRAFPEHLKNRFRADVFRYDPRTLDEILDRIRDLGILLDSSDRASELISKLQQKLKKIKPLRHKPTVVYEVMSTPLKVAGQRSIVTSIIQKAGGVNLIEVEKKHVTISAEKIIKLSPEFYIYQIGPMNRNPVPPEKRPYFRALKSRIMQVNEYEFARPGLNAFDAAVELNAIFQEIQQ